MNDYELMITILNGSKEYSFSGTVLTLRSYRTGEVVKLDLAKMDEEMFQELQPDEEPDEDEY